MTELDLEGTQVNTSDDATAPRGLAGLAILLAVLTAATAGALAYAMRDDWRPVIVWSLGVLSSLGLFGLLGCLAGFIRIGRAKKSDGLTAQILDQFEDACLVTDGRGRPVYANEAYRQFAGTPGGKRLVGLDKIYAGYSEISGQIYRLTQALEEKRSGTERLRLMAGSAAAGARTDANAWFKLMVSPLQTGDDRVLGLWRVIDLTGDKQEQETAFLKLQDIIEYLDHAPAGFFSVDANQKIQYVNATLASWLNIDLTQTTNGILSLSDIVVGNGAEVLKFDKLAAGEVRTETIDVELKTSDGTSLPVRIMHRVSADEQGRAMASRSLVLNRRLDVANVSDGEVAELKFSRFFNNAPIAIAQIDRSGGVLEANSAFASLFGTRTSGEAVSKFITEEAHAGFNAALEAARGGQAEVAPVEAIIVDKAAGPSMDSALRSDRTCRLFVNSVGGLDEGVSLVLYAIETTEQKTLELQFAQSQKMQAVGQLAGGVAHDFNNVLTAIIGFSDLLLVRHKPTDPSFQDIMNIKQNANRAANLVRQLLAFSRRQTLRPTILSLSDVLSDLGNLLSRLLGENIKLKTIHGRELGMIKVDINQFEQVIINLAVNARDAMPEGGELTVRTANISEEDSRSLGQGVMVPGEYVMCEVSDTGTGMSQEVLDKIYEPFFSTKEVGKGTGLGLSTVYGIVKQTGGFIFAESEIGRGTSFKIYLPRYYPTEEEKAAPTEVKAEPRKDLTGDGTILLVEDEDAVRAFATRALQSRGYTVLEASSGKVAVEVVDEHKGQIDLIISDVVMPEMDGPTLLKELRERGISTKVIFISGYAEEAFKNSLDGDEKFSFLPKPFSLKQLAAAVKQVMEGGELD